MYFKKQKRKKNVLIFQTTSMGTDCNCDAIDQIADYIILACPTQQVPTEIHGLTVLDIETQMLAEYHHCQHLIQTEQQHGAGRRIDSRLYCCHAADLEWMSFQKKNRN